MTTPNNGSTATGRSPYPPSRPGATNTRRHREQQQQSQQRQQQQHQHSYQQSSMMDDSVSSSTAGVVAGGGAVSTPPFYTSGGGGHQHQNLWRISNSAHSNWSPSLTSNHRGLPQLRFFDTSTTTTASSTSEQQQQQSQQQQGASSAADVDSSMQEGAGEGGKGRTGTTTGTSSIQDKGGSSAGNATREDDNHNEVVDGIPVGKLRNMTKLALGTSTVTGMPSTAVFYASLLYAKTQSYEDAYLYAQALYKNDEFKRCVRVLEQSNIIAFHNNPANGTITSSASVAAAMTPNPNRDNFNSIDGTLPVVSRELQLEAILLAAEALATIHEWQSVLDLLEDSTQQLLHQANNYKLHQHHHNHLSFHTAGTPWISSAPQVLDDHDDIAWDTLYNYIPYDSKSNHMIHPLSRLCLQRGKAYSQISHPTRAALYWKRAIKIDFKCVQALDCLLNRCLVTPEEAYQLIESLSMGNNDTDNNESADNSGNNNASNMEWLRDFYLARIELSPQDTIAAANANANAAGSSSGESFFMPQSSNANHNMDKASSSFSLDASAIQLSSPPPIMNMNSNQIHTSPLLSMTTTTANNDPRAYDHHDMTNHDHDNKNKKSTKMQIHVDRSFHKLWDVHNLKHSPEVLAMAARRSYKRYDWYNALKYCQQLSNIDPLCQTAAYVYIATLVALGHKRPLFAIAHEWVNSTPRSCRAWFAVGSYYYVCERYHIAQKHYCRATRLDPYCTEAWIAFGCSFASCDESDQALASFRAAQRLSPGEYSSLLYMGMEYLRTNHLVLAQYFLTSAFKASGGDPLCLNELGVLSIQRGDYPSAINWFIRALKSAVSSTTGEDGTSASADHVEDNDAAVATTSNGLFSERVDHHGHRTRDVGVGTDQFILGDDHHATSTSRRDVEAYLDALQDPYWESTIFNLGQCYRKTRQFHEAALCFERCVALCPDNSSGFAALAFTKHLMGHIDSAIDLYHQALSCKPDDPFSSEMLNKALQDALSNSFDAYSETENNSRNMNLSATEKKNYSMSMGDISAQKYAAATNGSSTWKSLIPFSPASRSGTHGHQQDGGHNHSSILMSSIEGGSHISVDTTGDDINMSLA